MSLKPVSNYHYQQAKFQLSAARLSQLPPDQGGEVAFVGRSNAGKSSVINAITGVNGLARTSKTPGRTQLINYFTLDSKTRLVDLPGYGYAKVSEGLKKNWIHLVNAYLHGRKSLKGLILIVDIRRLLGEEERRLLDWCRDAGLPVHVLLNKTDKLSHGAAKQKWLGLKRELAGEPHTVQMFSASKKIGVEEARGILDHWLRVNHDAS